MRDLAFAGDCDVEWENPAEYGGGWQPCHGDCEVVQPHRVGAVPAPPDPPRFIAVHQHLGQENFLTRLEWTPAGWEASDSTGVVYRQDRHPAGLATADEPRSCVDLDPTPWPTAPAEGPEPYPMPDGAVLTRADAMPSDGWEWRTSATEEWIGGEPDMCGDSLVVARPVALPQPPATVRVPVMTAIMDGRLSAGSKVPFYGVEWEGTQLAAQTIAGSQNVADDGTVEVLADPSLDAKTASEGGGVPVDQPPAPCTHETVGVLHRERASVGGELRRTEWCESCGAWRSIWHSGTVTRWISPGAADGGGEPTS